MKGLKGYIIACCLLGCLAWPVQGMTRQDSLFSERCQNLDLPILYIVTQDSVFPTYTAVDAPEGCDGQGITNNEKVPGRMVIVLNRDTIWDTGEYVKDTSGMTIKVRGNSTASSTHTDKKPYKIKLQKKKDLLFRGNESVYADKEWVLLRKALCETMVANMVNRALGMSWVPAQEPVFVFLNDNFRGIYLLSECIKRNTKCRVDIAKDGYLFEYDAYWWNEDFYINSRYKYNYTLKYPEADEILPEQVNYLTEHLQKVEDKFGEPLSLDSVIDVPSYARWLWVHDMTGSKDGGGSNMYLIKPDSTVNSKQAMICAWDFDGCFKIEGSWSSVHNLWWFKEFFEMPQREFVNEYIRMYDEEVEGLFDAMVSATDSLHGTSLATTLDSAFVMDNQRWTLHSSSAKTQFQTLKGFFTRRKTAISRLMAELKEAYILSAIPMVGAEEQRAFDVFGRPVRETAPGVLMIIRNSDGTACKRIIMR